jgi:hypothetical protein
MMMRTLDCIALHLKKKRPPAGKSSRKTKVVVEKPIIEERNPDNEDNLGLLIGKDVKEGSLPFEPIIEVSKPDRKDEADISKDTAADEPISTDKGKTNSPSSTPSADDADATKKPSPDF